VATFLGVAVLEKEGGAVGEEASDRWAKGGSERERKKIKAAGEGFPGLLLGYPSRVGPVGLGFIFFLFYFSFLFFCFLFCYLN
jgi:hypothetical protein